MTRILRASLFGLAFAAASAACAADVNLDGAWSGKLGREKPWPVTIVIANGKVIRFTEKGVPFDVRFSKPTANGIVFGDGYNYEVILSKSGSDVVSAEVHGRLGTGPARLTRS